MAGPLHHVIRRGEQCAATECKNHCIGVERSESAVGQKRPRWQNFWEGQLGRDDDTDQHANHAPDHGHDRKLLHDLVVIFTGCGEDIHLYGRITAVADVFDALSNDRCYKKAWPHEDVIKFFEQERGKQFDPNLVDLLLKNMEKISAIQEQYKDSFLSNEQ